MYFLIWEKTPQILDIKYIYWSGFYILESDANLIILHYLILLIPHK